MSVTKVRNAILARLIVPLVSQTPAWLTYGLALGYADARQQFQGTRGREVSLCIEQVFGPELDGKRRARIVRDYFRSSVCLKVDAIRLAGDGKRLSRFVRVEGLEHLESALSHGKGAILCTGHFGSVRACAGLLGVLRFPVTMVAEWSFDPDPSQEDSTSKAIIWKPIRHHLRRGNILVDPWNKRRGNVAVALEAAGVLRRNEVVVTNIDTGITRSDLSRSIDVDFMGRRSPILPGPTELARYTGAPLLTLILRRSRDWRHFTLTISPVEGVGPKAIQECMARLEEAIRQDPAQWELWKMSRLVRLRLYPDDLAAEFYKKHYGWWDDDLSDI
jgi:KDO2-lipid IV(A) lauroyltransferase